jgi:glycosyltransferase involved in cell wall biosynthesis
MATMKISLIIPVHNEEGNIPIVYREAKEVLEELQREKNYDYEIIFINDGSTDRTLEVLKKIKIKDRTIRVLNMDRNRGQSSALTAGFQMAEGEIIVSMDGDGQNNPIYIKNLVTKLEEGYKVVTGYRVKRKAPFLTRTLPSKIANWLIAQITGVKLRDNGCSLKAYLSPIPKKYQIPKGLHRFLPALFGVKNSEVCEIPVIDRPRFYGKSHYNLKRTFEVIRDLLTIPFILKNPEKYEKIFVFLSFFVTLLLVIFLFFTFKTEKKSLLFLDVFLLFSDGVCILVWKNLKRFNRAQKEGVFKVEEITL